MIHGHFQIFLSTSSWFFYLFSIALSLPQAFCIHIYQSIAKYSTTCFSSNPLSMISSWTSFPLINCLYMATCLMSVEENNIFLGFRKFLYKKESHRIQSQCSFILWVNLNGLLEQFDEDSSIWFCQISFYPP